jgi:raffinose/stachyose/melibiose transport system substrate-binding protein
MSRRIAGALVALASIAAAAVLVLSVSASASPKVTHLTVTVWSDWSFIKDAANKYMKGHPNVKITVSAIPNEQYFYNLPRTLGTSGGPDITVLEVTGAGTPYRALVKQKALVDLRGVWAKQKLTKVMPPAVTRSYTEPSGARYAVNVDETMLPVVVYNQDVFKSAGLTPPKNHRVTKAQFDAYVSGLKDKGEIPMTDTWTTDAHHLFQQYLLSSCGATTYYALANSWQPSSKVSWNQPCVVRGINAEKALNDEGVFGSNPIITRDIAIGGFMSGKAGMMLTGTWIVSQLKTDAKFGWDWFLMPPVPGGQPTKWLLYSADGFGINAKSKNIAAAKDFLATVMSKSGQSQMLSAGRPPSRTDVTTAKGVAPQLLTMVKSMKTLGSETHILGIISPSDFQDVITADSQNVLLGKMTAQQFAQDLQKLAVKLRAKKLG